MAIVRKQIIVTLNDNATQEQYREVVRRIATSEGVGKLSYPAGVLGERLILTDEKGNIFAEQG